MQYKKHIFVQEKIKRPLAKQTRSLFIRKWMQMLVLFRTLFTK